MTDKMLEDAMRKSGWAGLGHIASSHVLGYRQQVTENMEDRGGSGCRWW